MDDRQTMQIHRHRSWNNGKRRNIESGDEFYTDDECDDPNIPSLLNRSDWKRTPVRPRFPQ